jgi:hypothetical protein
MLLISGCDKDEENDPNQPNVLIPRGSFRVDGRLVTHSTVAPCPGVSAMFSDSSLTNKQRLAFQISDCEELEVITIVAYPFLGQDFVYPLTSSMGGYVVYRNVDFINEIVQKYYVESGEVEIIEYTEPTYTGTGWKSGRLRAKFSFAMVDTVYMDTVHITDGYIQADVTAF